MNNTCCPACGSDDLYDTPLHAGKEEVVIPLGILRVAVPEFSVCLACGTITPRLDRDALEAIRAWKTRGNPNRGAQ